MDELWLPITGFVGLYEVSNLGLVRSLNRMAPHFRSSKTHLLKGLVLKPRNLSTGYQLVSLAGKKHYIHRLVGLHFLECRDGYNQINHLDLNKQNNVASNLEWCDSKRNQQHAASHGIFNPYSNPRRAKKLSPELVAAIREARISGLTYEAIGKQFGINPETARGIIKLEHWKPI